MGKKVNSDFRHRKGAEKEQRQPAVDRISELPNEILVHILSFLTHEDAARTSVLSKRWIGVWMGLWMYADRLNFECAKMWEELKVRRYEVLENHIGLLVSKRQKYVKWVNKVLQSNKAIVLDVLRIRFDLDRSLKNDIDKWLQYALERRVQRLELNLAQYGSRNNYGRVIYDLPCHLLGLSGHGNKSGSVSPSDSSCRNGINYDASFDGFKSLRSLRFDNVNVCGSVLQFFLHNCPFLEHLVVGNSETLEQLEVCGPSLPLKHLEIIDCYKLVLLGVRDTNIVSLKVFRGECMVLKNVPKLVDVFVGGMPSENLVDSAISWLSCCLSRLEVLSLRIFNPQLPEGVGTRAALLQLMTLKQLTFFLREPDDYSLISFTALIRAAPNLEKFALKTDRLGKVRPSKKPRRRPSSSVAAPASVSASPLQRLKVVELCGYVGHESEVELVKYLLDNGVSLERIVVDPRDHPFDGGPVTDHNPKVAASFRNRAKQQLQGLVPSHVQLLLL